MDKKWYVGNLPYGIDDSALQQLFPGRTAPLTSILTATLFLVFSSMGPAAAQDNYATWGSSKTITLNTTSSGANITGNVLNFPVLIRLNPADFTDFANVHGAGLDIRFAKNNGTHMPYQIERFKVGTAGADTAEIWVKVDTVYGNNSTQSFKMWYNNATAADSSPVFRAMVWDTNNGFLAVYHGASLPPNILDATARNDNGTPKTSPTQVAGMIGKGYNFNRANEMYFYSSLDENPNLNPLTFSLWFKAAADTFGGEMMDMGNGTTSWSYQTDRKVLLADDGTIQFGTWTGGPNMVGSADTYNDNAWHHVAAVLDPVNGMFLFLDGALVNTGYNTGAQDFTGASGGAPHFRIGGNTCGGWVPGPAPSYYYSGVMDEIRAEGVARDSNWVKLCYQNQMAQDKLTGLSGTVATLPGVSPAKVYALRLGGVFSDLASSSTTIRYTVPSTGLQQLSFGIYDISGKKVWDRSVGGPFSAGENSLAWNGQNAQGRPLAAGTYFLRMTAVESASKAASVSKAMFVVPR